MKKENQSKEYAKKIIDQMSGINDYLDLTESLHKPGGKLFKISTRILQQYRILKYILVEQKAFGEVRGAIAKGYGFDNPEDIDQFIEMADIFECEKTDCLSPI